MFGTEEAFPAVSPACPACGHVFAAPIIKVARERRWHIANSKALEAYVCSLGDETHEWVLSLYVDQHLNLLSVETMARGGISSAPIKTGELIRRGFALNASGFFLVHNHPSGDPTPSEQDILVTKRLAEVSRDCDMPLLHHIVVAKGGIRGVGNWYW